MKNNNIIEQYDLIGKYYKNKENVSVKEIKSSNFIISQISSFQNKNILDVGCGYGRDIKKYEELGAKDVVGIDTSEYMVNLAKECVDKPNLIFKQNILSTTFPSNTFDIIIAKHSIHYIDSDELYKAYDEIYRILIPNGVFLFTVPHPLSEIFIKDSKNYEHKEIISFNAHSEFILKFPSHTISDYLSYAFLKNFNVTSIFELTKEESFIPFGYMCPVVLGICATKRR